MSGAYVGPDLTAEFGALPPSFLPVGMRRLIEAQLESSVVSGARVTITLPADYDVPASDAAFLDGKGVVLRRTNSAVSLRDALADVLGSIPDLAELTVLHGDTFVEFDDRDRWPDTFAAANTQHYATWADYTLDDQGGAVFEEHLRTSFASRTVACGLFEFSDGLLFQASLAAADSFIGALNAYSRVKALKPRLAARWLDFGHLQTYFESRKQMMSARAFNSLMGDLGVLRKRGTPAGKILAEAAWYQRLPKRLRAFTPQLIGAGEAEGDHASYELEYLYLPALSELFTFGELPAHVWNGILHSCADFLLLCGEQHPQVGELSEDFADVFFTDIIGAKTHQRLALVSQQLSLDLNRALVINGAAVPSLQSLAEKLMAAISPTRNDEIRVWHGDFHFANILYDFRARRVRCIDPRGILSDGRTTIFGDPRYDLAKLSHSVIGLYDLLVAGRFIARRNAIDNIDFALEVGPMVEQVQSIYQYLSFGRFKGSDPEILAITALLFLTMPPLHAEDPQRQLGMIANAYRVAELAGVI